MTGRGRGGGEGEGGFYRGWAPMHLCHAYDTYAIQWLCLQMKDTETLCEGGFGHAKTPVAVQKDD